MLSGLGHVVGRIVRFGAIPRVLAEPAKRGAVVLEEASSLSMSRAVKATVDVMSSPSLQQDPVSVIDTSTSTSPRW
jgi:hypothetical protein